MGLLPTSTPFWPLIAILGVDEVVAWVAMTGIATPFSSGCGAWEGGASATGG